MGFGGVGSMNVVLKNNRRLLPKRDKFKHVPGGYGKDKVDYNLPESTPRVLSSIREKIKQEQRKLLLKRSLVTVGVIVVLVTLFMYL